MSEHETLPEVVLHLTTHDLAAIVNTLDACASDEREPERYRSWYAEVAAKVRAQSDDSRSANA